MGARGPERTNVVRILDSLGIAHRVVTYEVDESDLSAGAAAEKTLIAPERIFKTLALRGSRGGIFLCCVPGDSELDLKKAARAAGEKSASMLPLAELQGATGYLRGGCSPIGTKKPYPVYVDGSANLHDEISVSAGARGSQVVLAPDDLLRALDGRAVYADLVAQ
ncbi:MAG: Cys-tRNA(Pro) deacylase [Spirochaetaceae bacterium]|nr:Cys-tRNA(Pro) deacylase [Spirochaetaceae bacterium]